MAIVGKWQSWSLFLCGICMGTADLIPGISGGTVAFILGFYQPLLESLKTLNVSAFKLLLTGKFHIFFQQIAWKFLLPLVAGIICAFICLANFFHFVFSHEVYRIFLLGAFFGLIVASFILCLQKVQKWNGKIILGLCLGTLVAYFLTGVTLTISPKGEYAVPFEIDATLPIKNYDVKNKLLKGLSQQDLGILLSQKVISNETPVYFEGEVIAAAKELALPSKGFLFNGWLVLCGACAVCALLLPGISGSYILSILGVYPLVIESLVDFINGIKHFSFDYHPFFVLFSLGVGIVIGGVSCSKWICCLLKKYPNETLAVLSGFMIGGIRAVWPFWKYAYVLSPLKINKGPQLEPQAPFLPSLDSPYLWQVGVCLLFGFVLLYYSQKLSGQNARAIEK